MSRIRAVGLLALACCGPAPGRTGYLWIDREALAAGASVEVGQWQGAPVLPLAMDVADSVRVLGPQGPRLVQVRPEWVAYVRGPSADTSWLHLGVDVREDAFSVDAPEDVARALAGRLDAQLAPATKGFLLTGRELVDHVAFLKTPDEVREAVPEPVDVGLPSAPVAASLPSGAMEVARPVAASPASVLTQGVGLYSGGGRALLLDAEGSYRLFSEACETGPSLRGHYQRSGPELLLTPREGAPARWRVEGTALVAPDGARLDGLGGAP